jgi:hypothetical protein
MIFLETMIRNLTRITPSGGCCRVGEASITIWYASDLWEWEYLGETFWDIQDLAVALGRGTRAAPPSNPILSLTSKACCRRCLANCLRAGASLSAGRLAGEEVPVRPVLLASPLSLRLMNYRIVRVSKDPQFHC